MKRVAIGLGLVLLAALVGVGFWLWTPDLPRATLEARYLADPGDVVDVAGMRLHLRDSGVPKGVAGDRPPVILLHGFGATLHGWEDWARGLAAERRVIRYDQPGMGLSDPDPTGDYNDARGVEVLGLVMDRLGVARASLVGPSMGGKIAWMFAAAQPDRVEKLVLVAPDGFAGPGVVYGEKAKVPATLALMRYALPRALVKMNLAPAFGDPAALDDARLARYHDLMLAPGARDAMLLRLAQTVPQDPRPSLRRMDLPVLLVWGEADRMIPVANAQDYTRELPQGRVVTLPGIGHLLHEEAPARSLPAVRAFLAE